MQDSEYELQAADGTPNGEVEAMDLEQLQKEKQDLEQQLTEKNKVRTPRTWASCGSALAQPSGLRPRCSSSVPLPLPPSLPSLLKRLVLDF